MGAPFIYLAAAAVVVTAAIVAAAVAAAEHGTAAAVAQQEDQDDDPANITTAETVVVTHKNYLLVFISGISRSFQDIPEEEFGAKKKKPAGVSGWFCYVLRPTDRRGTDHLR
jgi:hypothetical protein